MKFSTTLLLFLCTIFIKTLFAEQPAGEFNWHQKVFIENKGQIINAEGKQNTSVLFLYNDGLFNLQLKSNGFSYEIYEVEKTGDGFDEAGFADEQDESDFTDQLQMHLKSHRVDVNFEGANSNPVIETAEAIDAHFNYYYAPVSINQYSNLKGYSKIIYHDLYDGIDLVFYSPKENSAKDLRYEFVVHPGANLSKIKFSYNGATASYLNKKGDFEINTTLGKVTETKPKYFIEGNEKCVEGKFIFKKQIKSFSNINYDRSKFLIIDPNIIWGTYYGGFLGDEVAEVAVGEDKKAVIDGHTISPGHIATDGAYQENFAGGIYDYFVAKFKSDGNLDWATYFGGDDKDYCYALTVDINNNVIVGGNSLSEGLATAGAFQDSIYGFTKSDAVIAKFGVDGNLLWSTYFGGEGSENPRNIVTDPAGYIYASGTTGSYENLASPGAYQTAMGGFDDSWIAKFSPDGNRIWSTYYGDSGVDRSHALSLDAFGHLFVAGTTSSQKKGIATAGAHQTIYGGGSADAYLSKWDTSGTLIWATYYGGKGEDRCRGVETDKNGNVYLGGFTNSDSMMATPNSYQDTLVKQNNGGFSIDFYIAGFNSNGNRLWGTYLGGPAEEDLWGFTIDKDANALYAVGSTGSIVGIAYGNAMQPEKGGGSDGLISKFNTNGFPDWITYYGGGAGQQFDDVAVDKNGKLFVTGRPTGNDMYVTSETYQPVYYGGVSDAILYKFSGDEACFDQFEPNESIAASSNLFSFHVYDNTLYGYNANIESDSDRDWFNIEVEDLNPNIMIVLSDLSENYDIYFYDDLGSWLFESVNTDLTPDTLAVNSIATGIYYYEIYHAPGVYDSLNCYRLQVFRSDSAFSGNFPNGIHTVNDPLRFNIYPNPVSNVLSFSIPSTTSENNDVIIYDMLGRVVYSEVQKIKSGNNQINIQLNGFCSGPYTLMIKSQDQVRVSKFVKQ
ncbi:MAG: SBBP repeat-containing protein [Chitinophagales bacterium]|nr:SBBP repeat-containing protein [Chitinophagales bacterium]